MALVPDPEHRWRVDLTRRAVRATTTEPIRRAARARRAPPGYTRGYLRYLVKARELTGHAAAHAAQPRVRRAASCARLRDAVLDGALAEEAAALRGGAAP